MKTTMRVILAAGIFLLASATQSHAIEGLRISVQCPDVILGWPSNPGENYIVQWRSTLDPSTPWVTLTNSLPADWTTNWTIFVHSNQVQCASGGTNGYSGSGEGSPPAPGDAATATSNLLVSEPMVRRADGSGSTVPLCIYPPGIDLSPFIIFDPSTGEWMSGSGYTVSRSSTRGLQSDGPQPDGPQPDDPQPVPSMGFYQVVKVGVNVVFDNLTNGPVSGTITFPWEAGNDRGTLQDVSILVDGVRYRGATSLISPDFGGGLVVDTTFLLNGDHYFQGEATWLDLNASDPNDAFIEAMSPAFTLTVSNAICFPDWVEEIGELGSTLYAAQSTCTNADWTIDIYDVGSNFVQRLTGHTDDGTIEAYWDLTDTNGIVRTNMDVDPEFSSIITVSDPASSKTPKKKPVVRYPNHGRWVIAYQDTFMQMVHSNDYYQAIYSMGSIGAQFGGALTVFPSNPTNGQTFPMRYPSTNNPVSVPTMLKDQHALESLLTNNLNRNFYYNGHSSDQSFGGYLSAKWLSYIVKERGHYYRFVFLDSCLGANGGLPAAFGIEFNSSQPYSYFQKNKIRPRSFLGYPIKVHYCYSGSYTDPSTGQPAYGLVPDSVYYFLDNFEFYWYFNYDLSTAVYNAIQDTPYIGPGWETGDDLKLYGYDSLGVDDFNWQYQWSN